MFVSAIIVAGGRGLRLGADQPKQLLPIGSRTMLQRSIDAFAAHERVSELVVVLPADLLDIPLETGAKPIRVAAGGARRQDSVASGFGAASAAADIVLVHDGARPFVSHDLISRVIDSAAAHGAALPARQAHDTVKRAPAAGAAVIETIPRESIWLAQTPQGFRRAVLAGAMAKAGGADATDEAMLAERAGYPVHIVEGDEQNVKITTKEDLERARGSAGLQACVTRVGTGYDLHRLVAGRRLVLAGVEIPFDKGPLGHSDGDVVAHSLCDALFGAAALGDIGRHFPDRDPQWKDAAGLDLLARSVEIVGAAGWRVTSADVTVLLEKPKLSPAIDAIRARLAPVLGVGLEAVSIKAKTNEGVDAVGRGEAIAAHAVAVVTRAERAERVDA